MKFNLKKQIAAVIAASMLFSAAAVQSFAADFSEVSTEVGKIYYFLDKNEYTQISSTASNFGLLDIDDVVDAIGSDLITEAVIEKYDSASEAKTSVAELMVNSLKPYFSTDIVNLEANLKAADTKILPTIERLFDIGESTQWMELFLLTRKDAQYECSYDDKFTWANGTIADVCATLDALQVKTMEKRLALDEYSTLNNAIATLDWDAEMVVNACRSIMSLIDKDGNHVAEFALIKAAARYGSAFKIDGEEVMLDCAGADLTSEYNIIKYSPDELPITVDLSLEILLGDRPYDVTKWVNYKASTDGVSFEAVDDGTNKVLKTTISEKGTHDVSLYRISGESDWLSKVRFVVAYDLTEVIGLELEENILTWNSVEHAAKYLVNIYKLDEEKQEFVKVATTEVTDSENPQIDFDKWAKVYGTGKYMADVTALGDIPEEVGETYESLIYRYQPDLGTVEKPVWVDDTATLKWNSVEGATKYVVTIYKEDGSVVDTDEVTDVVDGENTLAVSALAGKYGTFYATVQAKNETEAGGVSEKSDALVLEQTITISGIAQLEGAATGSVREDNSGIKVTIKELPAVDAVYTNENGEYAFADNLPYVIGGYTLIFERASYLKTKVMVDLDADEIKVDDAYLYYGNFLDTSSVIINHFDLAKIIPYFYCEKTDDAWDENLSIGDDDIIEVEFDVVVRNYGKMFK